MGRPAKNVREKQSVRFVLNVTPAEKKQIEAAAAKEKLPAATFARLRLIRSLVTTKLGRNT